MSFSLGPTIDNFAAAVAEFHKKAQKEGREEVVRALQGFFESTPEIDEITWQQYTPHWNDGDACEFSIGDIYFKWTGKEADKTLWREEDDAYTHAWAVGRQVKDGQTQYDELSKKLQTLCKAINSNRKAFEVIFGDPADVTIRRDGSVEVEEFDHDLACAVFRGKTPMTARIILYQCAIGAVILIAITIYFCATKGLSIMILGAPCLPLMMICLVAMMCSDEIKRETEK